MLLKKSKVVSSLPTLKNKISDAPLCLAVQGFDKIIQEAGEKVVVVDYSTTWCGPCKMVYPKYVELSNQYPDVIFLKCVGDSRPELNDLMKREGIRAVPTFHIWKKGEKFDVINGARIEEVEAAIKALK
eukprot:gene6592-7286_t